MREHSLNEGETNPATLVRWGDAELVDPELCGLVGMDVVNCRHHPDDDSVVYGDDEMVPSVGDELCRPAWIDGTVEHIRRNVLEHRGVAGVNEKKLWIRGHAHLSENGEQSRSGEGIVPP